MHFKRIFLVAICALALFSINVHCYAEEDVMVEEESDVVSEDSTAQAEDEVDDDDDSGQPRPSANALTTFLFVEPAKSTNLVSGKMAKMLVGFENVGKDDFIVQSIDASLRYPSDYNYIVHNYTAHKFNYLVGPKAQATFDYALMAFDSLSGRPFLLVMKMNYKLNNGKMHASTVFNGTVFFTEELSNFDAETIFLYIVFCSFIMLVLVLLYQFLVSKKKKLRLTSSKKVAPVELGTSNVAGVDLEWIPKSALLMNNSAARTPRQRKGNRTKTAGEG